MTLMVESGAFSGRRELTKASLSNLSWMIQSPPSVAFLKKYRPMPPFTQHVVRQNEFVSSTSIFFHEKQRMRYAEVHGSA